MSKLLKKSLIAGASLLMLASVGAGTSNVNVNARHRRIHRVYHRSAWHKGTPRALRRNGNWISTFKRIKAQRFNHKTIRYICIESPLGSNAGYNPTPGYYSHSHKLVTTGADAGAGMAIRPYYKSLGHGWYEIVSGSITKHNPVGNAEMKVYVKIYSHNHVYIRVPGYREGNGNYYRHSWHQTL